MELRADEHPLYQGRPSWRALLSFYVAGTLGMHFGPTEKLTHLLRSDATIHHFTRGDLARQLACDGSHLALELPHTALARVHGDHCMERRIVEGRLRFMRRKARLFELPRDDVPLSDLELLALGVTREVHDFHPVEQRWRYGVRDVRGGDEQHLAEVEGDIQVMVRKLAVLRRIQDFEQSAGRIAVER